jgi:hypothetical protein
VESENTPENNHKVQQRMNRGFETSRSISKLEHGLQNDQNSSLAPKFDAVVRQTLSEIKDPKQRQQVLSWVQPQQKAEHERQMQGTLGQVGTTVGAVG